MMIVKSVHLTGLFAPLSPGRGFQPAPHSAANPDHLQQFSLLGRALGW